MKVVGLISGGKDSCFAMLECVRAGHELVALACLYPPDLENGGREELDSFMFQTVGVKQICPLIAQCMGLPLVSLPLKGKSMNRELQYDLSVDSNDEVEDMFRLLNEVKRRFPSVEGVSSGALLSNYQRIRVENVCKRLKLTSLALLWQRDQCEVLDSMIEAEVEAIVVKIASMGLQKQMLGKPIAALSSTFKKLSNQFGFHACGEGGEYETVTLNCPDLFRNGHIVVDEKEIYAEDNDYNPSGYLQIKVAHVEKTPRLAPTCGISTCANKAVLEVSESISDTGSKSTNNPVEQDVSMQDLKYLVLPKEPHVSVLTSNLLSLGGFGLALNPCNIQTCVWETLSRLVYSLEEHNLKLNNLCFVELHVSDMSKFVEIDQAYCSFFEKHNCSSLPPSRACVQSITPSGYEIVVSALATRGHRDVLHVRSLSKWAPVCIGNYSQSNTIDPFNVSSDSNTSGLVAFVAGQISLDPLSMKIIHEGDFSLQLRTCLNHCQAILSAQRYPCDLRDIHLMIVYTAYADESTISKLQEEISQTEWEKSPLLIAVRVPALPRNAMVEVQPVAFSGVLDGTWAIKEMSYVIDLDSSDPWNKFLWMDVSVRTLKNESVIKISSITVKKEKSLVLSNEAIDDIVVKLKPFFQDGSLIRCFVGGNLQLKEHLIKSLLRLNVIPTLVSKILCVDELDTCPVISAFVWNACPDATSC